MSWVRSLKELFYSFFIQWRQVYISFNTYPCSFPFSVCSLQLLSILFWWSRTSVADFWRWKGFFFFGPLFLQFKGGLISKIEGMALYFRRAFIFKPIDFVRTDYSSKESAVKWMLYRRLEFVGFTKADRVFFTAHLHNLVKLGSPGHLWRLTPSLRVSEHPPATHRCGIFVFLGRVFDSEEVPVLLFIEISTEVEWVLPSTSLSLVG